MGELQKEDFKKNCVKYFVEAKMEKKPVIFVEGKDDVPFYTRLCKKLQKEITIIPIDITSDATGHSCQDIIDGIDSICNCTENKREIEKNVLGIIDRDTREYRKTLPKNDYIIVLQYYSYENYLINRENIRELLEQYTNCADVEDEIITQIMEIDPCIKKKLYYFSLEALKNACIPSYNADFRYKDEIERIESDKQLILKLCSKYQELDSFADTYGIVFDDETMKKIVKGHWYLTIYSRSICKKIKSLHEDCRNKKITQCIYCSVGDTNQCQYKTVKNINFNDISNSLIKNYNYEEMDEVKQRILQLFSN